MNCSIKVNIDQGVTTAKLPSVTEPATRLVPNEKMALKGTSKKTRINATRQVSSNTVDAKLQDLGYVDFVGNLPKEEFIHSYWECQLLHTMESCLERKIVNHSLQSCSRHITMFSGWMQSKQFIGQGSEQYEQIGRDYNWVDYS